jgi:hypothetical protein
VLASLAFIPAAISVVAPAGPDDGCPSPRQLTEALGAHLPGIVVPLGAPPSPSAHRLAVAADAAGTVRVDLVDPGGEMLLRRVLTPGERTRAADCPALAETVALIVERYWHEVGYDVPPLPVPAPAAPRAPPPPTPAPTITATAPTGRAAAPGAWRWSLALAGATRTGGASAFDGSALLAGAVEGRIGLRLSAGMMETVDAPFSYATATFHRFPIRLGAYLPIPLAVGQLEPGVGIDLEEILLDLTHVTGTADRAAATYCFGVFCASPGADAALGWSVRSTHHVYLRALARAGVSVPYRFVADSTVLWSTPRTYLEGAVECGAWFQ